MAKSRRDAFRLEDLVLIRVERWRGSLRAAEALDEAEAWASRVLGAAGLPTSAGWFRETPEGWKKEAELDSAAGGLAPGREHWVLHTAPIRPEQEVEAHAGDVLAFAWLARRALEKNDTAGGMRAMFAMAGLLMLGRVAQQVGDFVDLGLRTQFKRAITDPEGWRKEREAKSAREASILTAAAEIRARKPALSERSVAAQVAKKLGLKLGTVRPVLSRTKEKLAKNRS